VVQSRRAHDLSNWGGHKLAEVALSAVHRLHWVVDQIGTSVRPSLNPPLKESGQPCGGCVLRTPNLSACTGALALRFRVS
jgi:hypothetical protein